MADEHERLQKMVVGIQKRVLKSAGVVATDAWMRSYWRAHPHKLVDFMTARVPTQVVGAGAGGEHVVRVIHSIPRSALDGPEKLLDSPHDAISGSVRGKVWDADRVEAGGESSVAEYRDVAGEV